MLTSILSLFLLYQAPKGADRFTQTMILSLVLAMYYMIINSNTSISSISFNNTAIFDDLSTGAMITSLVAILWVVGYNYYRSDNTEALALYLLLLIGIGALCSSNHILAIFVCIELQSLALYILLAVHVNNNSTNTHGITSPSRLGISYLINAAIATAMLLLGLSHSSSLLIIIALLWKLGSIPMHAWMISIVDALDISISAILLTITKLGILISIAMISTYSSSLSYLLLYAAMANLLIGSLISIQHYRYARLLSWLSIAQLGYVLLIVHYSASSTAMLYFELYSVYTILLLLCYNMPNSSISHMHKQSSTIVLWLLALSLYTVAGIPSAPIFWAKLELLLLTNAQAIVIALIGTIISSLIYVRIIKYASFYSYAIY